MYKSHVAQKTAKNPRFRMKLDDVDDFRATESNAAVLAEAEARLKDVQANLWTLVATELEGEDPWFYLRAYTAGLQEYVEAVSFYHHLRHGGLVSWDEVSRDVVGASDVLVPRADYMLGIADLTGEVMCQSVNLARFSNTKMCFELLKFLQVGGDTFSGPSCNKFSGKYFSQLLLKKDSMQVRASI